MKQTRDSSTLVILPVAAKCESTDVVRSIFLKGSSKNCDETFADINHKSVTAKFTPTAVKLTANMLAVTKASWACLLASQAS